MAATGDFSVLDLWTAVAGSGYSLPSALISLLLIGTAERGRLTLALDDDDMCLSLAVYGTRAEAMGDCSRGCGSGVIEAGRATGFKFASQRRSLAEGNCWNARRSRATTRRESAECR
jgi:hypothetical protein